MACDWLVLLQKWPTWCQLEGLYKHRFLRTLFHHGYYRSNIPIIWVRIYLNVPNAGSKLATGAEGIGLPRTRTSRGSASDILPKRRVEGGWFPVPGFHRNRVLMIIRLFEI